MQEGYGKVTGCTIVVEASHAPCQSEAALTAFVPYSVTAGHYITDTALIDYCLCSAVYVWLPSDPGVLPSAAKVFLGLQ